MKRLIILAVLFFVGPALAQDIGCYDVRLPGDQPAPYTRNWIGQAGAGGGKAMPMKKINCDATNSTSLVKLRLCCDVRRMDCPHFHELVKGGFCLSLCLKKYEDEKI